MAADAAGQRRILTRTLALRRGKQKRQNKQREIRRLHRRFKRLARDFAQCVRSVFFCVTIRPPTLAWQLQGTLDDLMLGQIAEWLVDIEKAFFPFKRFVDFSRLTTVAVSTDHVFKVARRRVEQFRGVEPVRTALFSEAGTPLAVRVCTSR